MTRPSFGEEFRAYKKWPKVHPDAKKSSAYVVAIEPTGSEGHPLPAVGGDSVVQACAPLALQQARNWHHGAQPSPRKQNTVRCDTHAGQV